MKTHKFQVGDKGFLRDGTSTYEVMLIDPACKDPIIVRIKRANTGTSYYSQRSIDGRYARVVETSSDLMPPKEVVWVHWWRHKDSSEVQCRGFSSKIAAESSARSTSHAWELIAEAVETEVPDGKA